MTIPAMGLVSVLWALSCLSLTRAALDISCSSLQPYNGPGMAEPQAKPSPFKIEVHQNQYNVGEEVRVDIESTADLYYRSFMIGAFKYPYSEGNLPVGQLILLDGQNVVTEKLCKNGNNFLLKGMETRENRVLKFVWIASIPYGHIEFRATFIVDNDVYWVAEKSRPVQDSKKAPLVLPQPVHIPPINVDGCGSTKGCFRQPADCIEPHCLYILTWKSDGEVMHFELGGLADGSSNRYVALGLSDDIYMGDDTVFTCADNAATHQTGIKLSYNENDPKKNVPVPSDLNHEYPVKYSEGSYQNGRLRCRFTVSRNLKFYYGKLFPLGAGPFHLLFANGFANEGQPKPHGFGVEDFPLASPMKINLYDNNVDAHGRAKYPLAKAHGCLMILAWIFFASLGILMTKYYKPMWPNKSMFGQKYWFLAHYNCMAMMFIISIIGIILIFVEAGGYSEAPDLPQKAHPILGIIILICIIINPIIALIRPNKDSDCRPVFNWFHWAFGTIAHVLAIPQIFIGMDFGKVMVPWYATWIVVIWVIFHIAVELTLEIHQCCTYKKNKERRKKHEQLKREYPKQHHPEPEPAGRRFKRFMLFLYLIVTTIITLTMIIIIAVA